MIDAVIFDVDGTIWDSTEVVNSAWNKALEECGHSERVTSERLKGLFGLPMDDIIKDILPSATADEREAARPVIYGYEDSFLRETGGNVYDGIEKMLETLSGRFSLFIVSNCQQGYIELMYDKTGFAHFFKDKLCPGDTGVYKADNIKRLCEKHGLKNPLYVGDTSMDEEACRSAGVRFCFASYGFGKAVAPDYVINTPMELCDILE